MNSRLGIIRIVALALVAVFAVVGADGARPAWADSHALVFNPSQWTLDEVLDVKTITVEVSGMTIGSTDTVQINIVHDDDMIEVSNPTCADLYGGSATAAVRDAGDTSTFFSCSDSGGPLAASGSVMTFDIKRLAIGSGIDEPTLTFGISGPFGTMFIEAGSPIPNGSFGTLSILKNHTPTATPQDLGTLEDTAKSVTLTGSDDNGDPLTFQVASGPTDGVLSGDAPDITYTPNADFNGVDSFTYTATDNESAVSSAVTVDLTITAVNDVPSFTGNGDDTVLEDATVRTVAGWATVISTGPTNEVSQSLSFSIGNDNSALFSVQPDIDEISGDLTYTVAGDQNGSALVTVSISDDGGVANTGVDTSVDQTFTISVTAVNDVPSFTKGSDDTVLEDSGLQTLTGWATSISNGPSNESSQSVDFIISNDNNGLFSGQPAVSAVGDLTYTPAADANGSTTVTIAIHDDGGIDDIGVDQSVNQTFNITVTAVNDEPSFTEGSDEVVLENSGVHSVIPWATVISPGPSDELGQVLTFVITNNNPSLFSAQPVISESTGDLTYTLAADTNGLATVTLSISDDGGVADGGDDTSPEITFDITVNPVYDITGTITFQGAALPIHVIAIGATVTVTHNGGGLFSTVAVASDGTFTITDAPVDTYTIAVTAAGYQPAEDSTLGVVDADIIMSAVELRGGLVNGDTLVDGSDISLVVTAFGTSPGARVDGGDNWVDINGDGAVSGVDISITLSNVTMSGVKAW